VGYNKNLDIQDYNELKENILKEKHLKKIKFDDQNQIIDDFQEKSGSKYFEGARQEEELRFEQAELSDCGLLQN
jgi:cell division protein FtsX